jgi:hypothetical protein
MYIVRKLKKLFVQALETDRKASFSGLFYSCENKFYFTHNVQMNIVLILQCQMSKTTDKF